MGIRVNFTDTEKYGQSSLGRDPLPTGKYKVAITDIETRESGPAAKFPGTEYLAFEFTVQDGDYQGRKLWANASLLPHALYTIKGILEALGYETTGNELDFEVDDLLNRELVVRAVKKPARKYTDSQGNEKEADEGNDVKSFYKADASTAAAGSKGGKSSLLP
jgi:hypothetical protein